MKRSTVAATATAMRMRSIVNSQNHQRAAVAVGRLQLLQGNNNNDVVASLLSSVSVRALTTAAESQVSVSSTATRTAENTWQTTQRSRRQNGFDQHNQHQYPSSVSMTISRSQLQLTGGRRQQTGISSIPAVRMMSTTTAQRSPQPAYDADTTTSAMPAKALVVDDMDAVMIGVSHGGKAPHAAVKRRQRISETPVAEVLKQKHAYKWTDYVLKDDATIQDAIVICIERGLAGMMIIKEAETGTESDGDGDGESLLSSDPSSQPSKPQKGRDVVVGLITTRDLLHILATGLSRDDKTSQEVVDQLVTDHMCPLNQIIFARPHETIGLCRTLMAKLQIQCLPIFSSSSPGVGGTVAVEGIITSRDLAEFGLDKGKDMGGKKNYLADVSQRVGLSSRITSMAEPPRFLKAHLTHSDRPLFVNVGIAALPHPFKGSDKPNTPSGNSEQYTEDISLSEDAHFHATVQVPVVVKTKPVKGQGEDSHQPSIPAPVSWDMEDEVDVDNLSGENNAAEVTIDMKEVTYMGVADGVGSWREYGVDPRQFPLALMDECRDVLMEHAAAAAINVSSPTTISNINSTAIMSPSEVMAQAYERVKLQKNADGQPLIGSCTACIGMFDSLRHQLHYTNLGDSGIMLLRHLDHNVAGTLKRDRPSKKRGSFDDPVGSSGANKQYEEDEEEDKLKHIKVQYVSQQQLMSFNHPYQLGWTGEHLSPSEALTSSLKQPSDSYAASLHVRRGDIIIMATDGLFDNVDVDDICQMAVEWETKHNFLLGDVEERARRWQKGESKAALSAEVVPDLAATLCQAARQKSLQSDVDSPFAILAKENDILWSGGMPDDCTVIAMHVVGRASHDDADVDSV
jgi:protein phosphatase PTC7